MTQSNDKIPLESPNNSTKVSESFESTTTPLATAVAVDSKKTTESDDEFNDFLNLDSDEAIDKMTNNLSSDLKFDEKNDGNNSISAEEEDNEDLDLAELEKYLEDM